MQADAARGNHNASVCVALPDTFCKETSPWLKTTAPRRSATSASPSPNLPATSASSSAALSSPLACFCGLFWEIAIWARKTLATPTTSALKRPSHLRPLTRLHQPRLTLSPRPLLTLSRLHLQTLSPRPRLTLSRLRLQIRHLPHLRQHLQTRNTVGLRAGIDLTILGGHRAVSALFPYLQGPAALASNLPTGMTRC